MADVSQLQQIEDANGKKFSIDVSKICDINGDLGDKASASVTIAAHTAITSRGATSDFSYLVWNDLVDKVIEALTADGDSWNTNNSKYLSSSSTKMSPSDKVLTAKRFNALRWNIGRKYSTDITDRSKGQQVLGSYFTTLTDALNSWIATIT